MDVNDRRCIVASHEQPCGRHAKSDPYERASYRSTTKAERFAQSVPGEVSERAESEFTDGDRRTVRRTEKSIETRATASTILVRQRDDHTGSVLRTL